MTSQDQPKDTVHEPFDIDLEQALLGSLIRDPSLVSKAVQHVDGDHFYDPLHARIFDTIKEWSEAGEPQITAMTLAAAMKSDPGIQTLAGELEHGGQYLHVMAMAAPAIPAVATYAKIIRELALRRDALAGLAEATAAIKSSAVPVNTALRPVMGVVESADRLAAAGRYKSAFDTGMESLREAQRASAGGRVRSVKTGITKLDDETGGFQGADLVIIAGRSGMGKSALMGGISWRAARAFVPTIIFSLEMKRPQWVQRLVTDIDFETGEAPIHYRKYRSGGFTDGEFARCLLATQALQDWPWLEIHDDDGLTMAQIAGRCRAFQAKWKDDPRIREGQGCPDDQDPIGLVGIDYLQIVDPASRVYRPREQEVRDIARGSKALAKNLDWPVMAGSQLNEDDKNRAKDEKRPQGGDVRESKAIYHEADIMIAPYREWVYVNQQKPAGAQPGDPAHVKWLGDLRVVRNKMELLGIKNRMGRNFDFEAFCDMASNSVRDHAISRAQQQEADDLLKALNG